MLMQWIILLGCEWPVGGTDSFCLIIAMWCPRSNVIIFREAGAFNAKAIYIWIAVPGFANSKVLVAVESLIVWSASHL